MVSKTDARTVSEFSLSRCMPPAGSSRKGVQARHVSANARVSHHREPIRDASLSMSTADVDTSELTTRTQWATSRMTALERKQVYARLPPAGSSRKGVQARHVSANARASHHRKPVPSIADVERELSPTRTEWATTRITALERKQVYARLLWFDDYKSLFQADGSGNQTLLSNLVGTYTSAHTRRLMQRDSILSDTFIDGH